MVVVEIEAAPQSETRVEHKCPHERAGPIPAIVQQLGERLRAAAETGRTVDVNAVMGRDQPGHDRGVRRQRHRRVRVREGKANAGRSQTVDRRRQCADPIGAQCVDGHEEHIRSVQGTGFDRWKGWTAIGPARHRRGDGDGSRRACGQRAKVPHAKRHG